MHHEYHAPFALVTQHAHPIEVAVTGGFSIVAPIAIGAHPLTMWAWLIISVAISIDAHFGYDAPIGPRALSLGIFGGTVHHDEHHRRPWANFAPFLGYLDELAGTAHDCDAVIARRTERVRGERRAVDEGGRRRI